MDDSGDIDRNGIPDSIQADPIGEPPIPFVFGEPPAPAGLPGIDSPIDETTLAEAPAPADAMPEPVRPTPPPADADEVTQLHYLQELQKYNRLFETYSQVLNANHDMMKSIIDKMR